MKGGKTINKIEFEGFIYSIKEGTIENICIPDETYLSEIKIRIPNIINGIEVKKIGERVFDSNKKEKSSHNYSIYVFIDEGIELSNYSFAGSNIEGVELPKGIKIIPEFAFCESKLRYIDIPPSIEEIGEGAFFSTYIEEIEIPDSVTKIGPSAFTFCGLLHNVKYSSGINFIPEGCFSYCNSLSEIHKIEHVEEIQYKAFMETGLVHVSFPSVKEVCESAFAYCRSLCSISFGEVETLGDECFYRCREMTAISGIENVYYIGERCFTETSFKSFIWPKPCEIISIACFAYSKIESFKGVENITEIESSAFAGVPLTVFDISNSFIDKIADNAFDAKTKVITNFYQQHD